MKNLLLICLFVSSQVLAQVTPIKHVHTTNPNIDFIPNVGQLDSQVLYSVGLRNCNVFMEPDGIVYNFSHPANAGALHEYLNQKKGNGPILKFHAYRMTMVGANKNPNTKGSEQKLNYYNYFRGKDESKWKGGIHPFASVSYNEVYDGIDLYAGSDNGRFVYDFIVAPGADPNQIQLRFDGVDNLRVHNGKLIIGTSITDIEEVAPYVYQEVNGQRVGVACRYNVQGTTLTYEFPRGYDRTNALVIDPTVVFATFTGSTADNWGCTATYDEQGNFYAGGVAFDFGYPTTLGAFQSSFGGLVGGTFAVDYIDVSITKFNPTGTTLIYSTYIGGDLEERPHSMMVDANGELVLTGHTKSSNFPVTAGAFQTSLGGDFDIFVTRMNPTGTALVGSTYVGGSNVDGENTEFSPLYHNYGDHLRGEVILDNSGNVYVAGNTWSSNFPVTGNAIQSTLNGAQDGVVLKLNPGLTALIWSTYIGGTGNDAAYNIVLDNAQTTVYLSGGSNSSDFPTTPGTYQPGFGGVIDGFIAKFQNSGTYPLQRATYIGESDYDQSYGLQVDWNDNVYATGQTLGGTFPVSAGVYTNPSSSQFLMKLDPNLNASIFSTVFGSGTSWQNDITPTAFLVDTCGSIYIAGWGGLLGYGSTFNLPVTADAIKPITDGRDFYFIVFTQNAQNLLYATFMGTDDSFNSGEHVDGGTSRFNKEGVIYEAICGGCGATGFPTTPGVWAPNNLSSNCNEISLKIAFQLVGAYAEAGVSNDTVGCAPFDVQFQNNSANASTYLWDFDDGTPTTNQFSPLHTFTSPGTYIITLVATNDSVCISSDTTHLTIIVFTQSLDIGPDTSLCEGQTFTINPGIVGASYQWQDGSTTSSFVVDADGTYALTVTVNGCFATDSIDVSYSTQPTVFAGNDTTVCNDIPLVLHAESTASNFLWSTGATTQNITVNSTNNYIVTVTNGPCEAKDTVLIRYHDFEEVNLGVDTAFCEGTFYHLNVGLNNPPNLWSTGDTTSIITITQPGTYWVTSGVGNCYTTDTINIITAPVPHINLGSDTFICADETVTLTAGDTNYHYLWYNDAFATSIVVTNPPQDVWVLAQLGNCQAYDEIYIGLDPCYCIYIPNAFSPNADDMNDRFNVIHCPLEEYLINIYNRWGEKLYTSNDPDEGWDGMYKGLEQPVSVYVYYVQAKEIGGDTHFFKGNVTLLR